MRRGGDSQRRRRADAPAGKRRDRLVGQGAQLAGSSAAADDERRHAAFLRRQLQPPALREVECRDLAHHGAETAAAQGLLQRPQRIGIAAHLKVQQPVRVKSGLWQRACVKIALPGDPQHAAIRVMPMAPANQSRNSGGGETRFLKIRPLAGKFMQRAQCQATPGKMKVDGAEAPGEGARGGVAHAGLRQLLQGRDLAAQGRQTHRPRGGGE